MVHLHIQIPPESIEIYQKCTLCRVFFSMNYHFYGVKYVQLWIPIFQWVMKFLKNVPFLGGEELLKWRKCLQCDEIWSDISNRIMRGRVGPYGGQEQLLLKSWRKYLECDEIPMIKHQ